MSSRGIQDMQEETERAAGAVQADVEGATSAEGPARRVAAEIERLETEIVRRKKGLSALRPLARSGALDDLRKLERRIAKIEQTLPFDALEESRVGELFGALREHVRTAPARLRQRLGRELKTACDAAGVQLEVLSREEPVVLRLAPIAVAIDFDKGEARLSFARQQLGTAPARSDAILEARRTALARLDTPFDPREHFEKCWEAYRLALAATGRARGERVELVDYLPQLALLLQGRRFQVDPIAANWHDYPRARFAYDVLRLRRANALEQGGRRMHFGVATGATASNKSRVLFLEDETGHGEYKLTIYFTEGSA